MVFLVTLLIRWAIGTLPPKVILPLISCDVSQLRAPQIACRETRALLVYSFAVITQCSTWKKTSPRCRSPARVDSASRVRHELSLILPGLQSPVHSLLSCFQTPRWAVQPTENVVCLPLAVSSVPLSLARQKLPVVKKWRRASHTVSL